MNAEAILKATKVDGIYTADPKKDPTATRFDRLDYMEVLQRGSRSDGLDRDGAVHGQRLPIIVFDMAVPGQYPPRRLGRDRSARSSVATQQRCRHR